MADIRCFTKSYSCILWPWKHMLRQEDFDRMSSRSWHILTELFFCTAASFKYNTVTICYLSKWYSCILWLKNQMIKQQGFDHVSPRGWDIDWNMFSYDGHFKNPTWPPSTAFPNGTVVILDPEIKYLDTIKILIVFHLEAEILKKNIFLYDGHL